jgi:hypothetical protein
VANTSKIAGFRPVKHVTGAPYNGQCNSYTLLAADGTAVYVGDAVKLSGTADSGYGDKPSITLAAAGDAIIGIVVGFAPLYTDLNITGQARAASTLRTALVCDAPDMIFEVETSNGTPGIVDVGLNLNHAVGTPSASAARSGATVDMGTKAATAALTFKLVGFVARDDNDPAAASAKVLVKVNNHQLSSGTGTAGV